MRDRRARDAVPALAAVALVVFGLAAGTVLLGIRGVARQIVVVGVAVGGLTGVAVGVWWLR